MQSLKNISENFPLCTPPPSPQNLNKSFKFQKFWFYVYFKEVFEMYYLTYNLQRSVKVCSRTHLMSNNFT